MTDVWDLEEQAWRNFCLLTSIRLVAVFNVVVDSFPLFLLLFDYDFSFFQLKFQLIKYLNIIIESSQLM